MNQLRNYLIPLFLGLVGFIPLYNVLHGPGAAGIRGVDVWRLVGAGMLFGVSLTWLGTMIAPGNRPKD